MPRICSIPGCGRPHKGRGLCSRCWMRWWRHGSIEINLRPHRGKYTECRATPDCGHPVYAFGWCRGHYDRWRKTGRLTDLNGDLYIERKETVNV